MAAGDIPMLVPAVVKTTCPYCGTGCGVDVTVDGDRAKVSGDKSHPTNSGKLCVKGTALGDTVVPHGRLLYPQIRDDSGAMQRTSWDDALDHVASKLQALVNEHGRDAIAWYVSGQLLTEDYYVANKLVKGFVGTANIDTNSRLCMSSAVAGHKRAFGEDIVPVAYADLELADLVVLVGSNTAWCHPILFQRIVREKERRPELKIVVIDPRRTATTEMADLHLPVRAGADVRLFNGLLSYLNQRGIVDTAFVERSTTGLSEALAAAEEGGDELRAIADQCGLDATLLGEFYRLFAVNERVITCFSMGVNQSSAGTDKVNAIINCHLLTGRIGKPGAGPFSLTGQPNAMGGREVGGLSNMLAAHMDLESESDREKVQSFWDSPSIASKPGLKAVDLFDAIDDGRIKAVWIMATNPVVSLPDADKIKRALAKCELVIVSDVMQKTDTTAFAHVLLPAQGWGEKDGTVTNSERCISRQRAFVAPLGEAKADWWMLAEVARRWGFDEQFAYDSAVDIFDEHARLSAWRNDGSLYFYIGGLVGLKGEGYDALQPVRWPVIAGAEPAGIEQQLQVFADGRYYHGDGRARFVPTAPRMPVNAVDADFPLVLNTGRVRDHWHTMTRTGLSATLASHIAEPFVDLHAQDALISGVADGALARVSTRWGNLVARVKISGEMPRGTLFVPIHWNAQYASDARVGGLVNPVVDPVSGEPEFKHTPAKVEPFTVAWHGFVLSRGELPIAAAALLDTWWTRVTGAQFNRYELAGRNDETDWPALARRALDATDESADWLEYEDRSAGIYRAALVVDDKITACIFVSKRSDLPSRAWLSGLFAKDTLADPDRIGLLVGEPLEAGEDQGVTVCSCWGVGRNRIIDGIRNHGLNSVAALGEKLQCGTNCGSCVPELKVLLAQNRVAA
jgi:assimilatory nitrate reductase catalytic subunit